MESAGRCCCPGNSPENPGILQILMGETIEWLPEHGAWPFLQIRLCTESGLGAAESSFTPPWRRQSTGFMVEARPWQSIRPLRFQARPRPSQCNPV
jgi:hypothetical protein